MSGSGWVGECVDVAGVAKDDVVLRDQGVAEGLSNGSECVANDQKGTTDHHHQKYAHEEPHQEAGVVWQAHVVGGGGGRLARALVHVDALEAGAGFCAWKSGMPD